MFGRGKGRRDGEAYEIEFFTVDGNTLDVVTVEADQVRPVSRHEVMHAPHWYSPTDPEKAPPMSFRFDHAVILVNDLAAATADYTAAGFTVTPGGEHTGGVTYNALIGLADGSYLELLAFTAGPEAIHSVEPDPHTFLWRVAAHSAVGQGLVDFALLSDALDADVAAAQGKGLAIDGPLPGGRQRPDGVEMVWQFALPHSLTLPFLIADVTPRSLRAPGGAATQHANGATGVLRIDVGTRDRARADAEYAALLGREALPAAGGSAGESFLLTGTALHITPQSAAPDRPIALTLATERSEAAGPLDPALTHGAAITLITPYRIANTSPDPL